eukprot:6456414-Amphidinium_carterae.1
MVKLIFWPINGLKSMALAPDATWDNWADFANKVFHFWRLVGPQLRGRPDSVPWVRLPPVVTDGTPDAGILEWSSWKRHLFLVFISMWFVMLDGQGERRVQLLLPQASRLPQTQAEKGQAEAR